MSAEQAPDGMVPHDAVRIMLRPIASSLRYQVRQAEQEPGVRRRL